jgi:predicted AAA+ superfamily ATPase
VHLRERSDEYRDPAEFYRRTFLTESLKNLLIGAMRRLADDGGAPVVELQTNFGGGKNHSMLALYHLFSGTEPGQLLGVDALMADAGITALPHEGEARRTGGEQDLARQSVGGAG